MSSMGDVIHVFPALTDLAIIFRGRELQIDWVVEESFVSLCKLHPAVNHIIPVAIRRWRKAPFKKDTWSEVGAFRKQLNSQKYDIVIDAQGLLKSALVARLAKGKQVGYDRASIREPLASLFYNKRYVVSREQHAVDRMRQLFASAFEYSPPETAPNYGLTKNTEKQKKLALFIHSTSWESKHLPESHWVALVKRAAKDGYEVMFPWYSAQELMRAKRIIEESGSGLLLPKLNLDGLAEVIARMSVMVGTDTGLSHLAAAYNIPGVIIYGSTSKRLTGVVGQKQISLQMDYHCSPCLKRQCLRLNHSGDAPCYLSVTPEDIWGKAMKMLSQ